MDNTYDVRQSQELVIALLLGNKNINANPERKQNYEIG